MRRLFVLLSLAAFAAGHATGWHRVSVYVADDVQAQRVSDCPLGLFSEDVTLGMTDLIVGPRDWPQLFALNLPFKVVSQLPDPVGWDKRYGGGDGNWHTEYLRYNDIIQVYEGFRAANPNRVSRAQIATSWNGRAVYVYRFRLTPYQAPGSPPRKKVIILGGTHAREWISPAVTLILFERLLTEPQMNPVLLSLLAQFEFYFVPVLNPDGYEFSWTNNRMWRKNRRNNGSSFGVDLNRNYPKGWGGQGSSGNPSSDTYRGPSVWSEPETAGLRDFIASIGGEAYGFIDYHSYGQKILWPWTYTTNPLPEPERTWHFNAGAAYRQGLLNAGGINYEHGQASTTLYVAGGTSKDWGWDGLGAIAFTVEMRDTGQNGFLLPPDQILPTANENWGGFKAFLQFLAQ